MRNNTKQNELRGKHLYENDSRVMREAIEAILAAGYHDLRRPSRYQLKVGGANFYPERGTVQIDGLKKQKARGLSEFFRVLRDNKSSAIDEGLPILELNDLARF